MDRAVLTAAGIAPSEEELANAYAYGGGELAGHSRAEAVECSGSGDITVLCSIIGASGREHSALLVLDGNGAVVRGWGYGEEYGVGRAMARLPTGALVVAGELLRAPLEYVAAVTRLDTLGQVSGFRSLDRSGSGLVAVTVLSNGSALAGGGHAGRGLLVRDDSDATVDGVEEVLAVAAAGDGGHVFAGVIERSTSALGRTVVEAGDPPACRRWTCVLPEAGGAEPSGVAILDLGGIVVAGHREPPGVASAQLWIACVDRGGEPAWERTLEVDADGATRGRAVVSLPGGHCAVAGDVAHGGLRRTVVARLDAAGEIVWARQLADGDEVVRALAVTADGGLVVAGARRYQGGRRLVLVRRLAGDGDVIWARTYVPG